MYPLKGGIIISPEFSPSTKITLNVESTIIPDVWITGSFNPLITFASR